MKKQLLSLVVLLACTLVTQNASAQIDVKLRPLGLFLSNMNANVEFGIKDNFGVEAMVGYDWLKVSLNLNGSSSESDFRNNLVRLGLNGRYYFNPKKGLDNFYMGAYTRFRGGTQRAIDSVGTASLQRSRVALGIMLGYKVVSRDEKFVFDFSLGLGRAVYNNFRSDVGSTNLASLPFVNIDLPVSIAIGYRFGGGDGESRSSSKSSRKR